MREQHIERVSDCKMKPSRILAFGRLRLRDLFSFEAIKLHNLLTRRLSCWCRRCVIGVVQDDSKSYRPYAAYAKTEQAESIVITKCDSQQGSQTSLARTASAQQHHTDTR